MIGMRWINVQEFYLENPRKCMLFKKMQISPIA